MRYETGKERVSGGRMRGPLGTMHADDGHLKRERLIVGISLLLASLAAWIALFGTEWPMPGMGAMPDTADMGSMPGMSAEEHMAHMAAMANAAAPADWSTSQALAMFAMWALMMVAMMLPSAAPMVMFYAGIARRYWGTSAVIPSAFVFAGVYVALWLAVAAAATVAQWALAKLAPWSAHEMALTDHKVAGVFLVMAGIYQFSSLKEACLMRCRAPLGFIMAYWRPGFAGALRLGWRHGIYCIGCCAVLMSLLFVGGVMNPLWVIGLSVLVFIEKAVPSGDRFGQAAGMAAMIAGVALITGVQLP